ncbi:MAG: hypothetical protein RMK89_00925 [Armatimonadota bacterium]|nr:hypothetical protein [Armatimonadota bacterium]MDW8142000.1 hypothetical protein [Armatimonadota bacterium]
MSERFWMLLGAGIVVVVVIFSVWYFATSRPGQPQPARQPTKTMEEWRQYYEQKIKPSPVPGQYKAPVKPVP